jgi:exonuclease VII small subunit
MTTVNNFVDILRIIREQPEWGEALRSALLSKEVLELPQRLAEFADTTNRRLATLEGDVTELKAGQARLEEDVTQLKAGQVRLETGQARLEGAVGNLRGAAYEQEVANNIATIVSRPLGIRRVRLLKGHGATDSISLHELMDDAQDRGIISGQERVEAGSTDLVIQGERHKVQSTVYVALEISVTAADSDINRAADRSELLHRATGEESVPAVVSAHIDADRGRLAEERNVTFISFGE